MSARLEDHRPAATDGSLARSFVGSWLRDLDGWVATADVVRLLGDAGVSPSSARTALSRLKGKGVLVAQARDGVPGYRLADDAHPMLARGDRRIYGHRQMRADEPWMLVVFSVPEAQRSLRHRMRAQLTWLGCGSVTPGVWIGPGHLLTETRQVLEEVRLLGFATLFTTGTPVTDGSLADAVPRWWDLDELATRYEDFLAVARPVAQRWAVGTQPARQAFADHLHVIDAWRSIPYLDPGLPEDLLPAHWPGAEGVALFARLQQRLHDPARRHLLAATARTRR